MDTIALLQTVSTRNPPVSPLILADRLITLAQDAERAGYQDAASHLVTLVYTVLDDCVQR